MKRVSTTQGKGKSRSINRTASVGLVQYLNQKYDKTIPVSALTAAHKIFGKGKPLSKEDRFVSRFSDGKGNIDTQRLVDYLGKTEPQEKGKGLSEDAMKRVYDNFCNHDGKLTFEYIMKMGESCGITINVRTAKAIVRKYGKRKDHLSIQDCLKINNRRNDRSSSPKKGK